MEKICPASAKEAMTEESSPEEDDEEKDRFTILQIDITIPHHRLIGPYLTRRRRRRIWLTEGRAELLLDHAIDEAYVINFILRPFAFGRRGRVEMVVVVK